MNAALRERIEAERAEARELFAKMRPELVLQRLREGPAEGRGEAADAPTLRERLEVERAEARELLGRMRPRQMAARVKGPQEPTAAQPSGGGGAGNTLAVVAGCFVLGLLLARLLDWRGHAHPQG
jgi:5-formyltetrahydrofolate cyclo-ligase